MRALSKYAYTAPFWTHVALVMCFVFTIAPFAQSAVLDKPTANKAVAVKIGQFVRLAIDGGEQSTAFTIDVPVAGLLYFSADQITTSAIRLRVFSHDGKLLGIDGAHLTQPGVIRVEISRRSDREKHKALPVEGRFIFLERNPDAFEPNETPETARALKLGPDHPIAGGPIMLFPKGDIDWFRLKVTSPGLLTPFIMRSADNKVRVSITSDVGHGIRLGKPIPVDAGIHNFKISSDHSSFELMEVGFEYSPVWDDCSSNIRPQEACVLVSGKPLTFTLFPVFSDKHGNQQSGMKRYSLTVPGPGYIVLSVLGMPHPKYDAKNNLISGLKLQARAFLLEGENLKYAAVHISDRALIILTKQSGTYTIELGGNWINTDPFRAMKLIPRFRLKTAINAKQTKFAILGTLPPDNRSDRTALGLAMLAGIGEGHYGNARTSEQIELAVKEFIGGRDKQISEPDTNKQSDPPAKGIRTKNSRPKIKTALPAKDTAKPINTELVHLLGLRAYLAEAEGNFLYRHHLKTQSGEIIKRLNKTKIPEQNQAALVLVKTEKFSPIISSRLLERTIQMLE